MTGKRRRYFQYRVTEVGGSMVERINVDDLTFDYWQGKSHTYCILNLETGEETGYYCVKSEGECTPEQYEQLRSAGREVAA